MESLAEQLLVPIVYAFNVLAVTHFAKVTLSAKSNGFMAKVTAPDERAYRAHAYF